MYADEILKAGGLFTTRIVLQDAFDPTVEGEAGSYDSLVNPSTGEPYFIELGELHSDEMLKIQSEATNEQHMYLELSKLIPTKIVKHNIIKSDGSDADHGAILNILRSSGSLMTYVMQAWNDASPLARRMQQQSTVSPG